MPRKLDKSPEQVAAMRQQMLTLRHALKMSRTNFAKILGFSPDQISARELGRRSTWNDAEILHAKYVVQTQIAAVQKVLQSIS